MFCHQMCLVSFLFFFCFSILQMTAFSNWFIIFLANISSADWRMTVMFLNPIEKFLSPQTFFLFSQNDFFSFLSLKIKQLFTEMNYKIVLNLIKWHFLFSTPCFY